MAGRSTPEVKISLSTRIYNSYFLRAYNSRGPSNLRLFVPLLPSCMLLSCVVTSFPDASNVQGSYRRYNKYKIAKEHKNKKKKVERKKKNMDIALDTHDFTRQK